jgi:hypothetical protein
MCTSLFKTLIETSSSSSSGSTILYGPWSPWWSSPRYSYQVLSSTMSLLSITLHLLRHYQATLICVFPFSREPSGCEKAFFLQGEFYSILTKCPSRLILAAYIILIISRSLYKQYSSYKRIHTSKFIAYSLPQIKQKPNRQTRMRRAGYGTHMLRKICLTIF